MERANLALWGQAADAGGIQEERVHYALEVDKQRRVLILVTSVDATMDEFNRMRGIAAID